MLRKKYHQICVIIRRIKTQRCIFVFLCFVLLTVATVSNISNSIENKYIENVKRIVKQIEVKQNNSKDKEINFSYQQDEAIVLLNVGDKPAKEIDNNDIQNIILMIFNSNDQRGKINFLGVQKEVCVSKNNNKICTIKESFDREEPAKFYKNIEKVTGYKVNSYISYNSDTIKEIMDLLYIIKINVVKNDTYRIDDVPVLNSLIEKYADKYHLSYNKKVTTNGWQSLRTAQVIAFSNMYSDEWECMTNDWRQMAVLVGILEGIKDGNYFELEKLKRIILSGDNTLNPKQLLRLGAKIKTYNSWRCARWPNDRTILDYKKRKYVIPTNELDNIIVIHKKIMKEHAFKLTKMTERYTKKLAEIQSFISSYTKRNEKANNYSERNNNQYVQNDDKQHETYKNDKKRDVVQRKSNSTRDKTTNNNQSKENDGAENPASESEPEPKQNPEPDPQPQTEENNSSDVLEE